MRTRFLNSFTGVFLVMAVAVRPAAGDIHFPPTTLPKMNVGVDQDRCRLEETGDREARPCGEPVDPRAATDENKKFLLDLLREANGEDGLTPRAEEPVGPGAKKPPEKEAFTAWGKEVGGLQVGLGFRPGEQRAYHIGETVQLVVRVRNVSKVSARFQCQSHFFLENPPVVTDDTGKPVRLTGVALPGQRRSVEVRLAGGEEAEIQTLNLELRPPSERDNDSPWTLFEMGKLHIQYQKSGQPPGSDLNTGKLELEVKDANGRKTQTGQEPAHKVKELQKERIATLNDLAESSMALARTGRGELRDALEARMTLLQAELEMAEQAADRIALYKKALESMKKLEELAVARKAAAQGTEVDVLKARAKRLEIEIALARSK